jgi:hypothetical protein
MRHLLSTLLIIAAVVHANAQDQKTDLAGFFGKKWVTSAYEIHGEKHDASDIPAGDGTIFQPDGTFSSTDKGVASTGTWTYDASDRILTVQTKGYDEPNRLKLIRLEQALAVMESVHEDEAKDKHHDHAMTIYLKVSE